ncbi:MAG TPA: hypothetical protein DEA96_11160 [Leptospiraceae bacterium]|nr:hypothetical protein [Spirochaetaceae bacterium]HBS05518.1 hypothetical protein [Leptospiraceae bacterium]|tara:strand:+ start:2280 stop:3395 length:1116 start_codon:yes stop_codon:yes gene_type:complete
MGRFPKAKKFILLMAGLFLLPLGESRAYILSDDSSANAGLFLNFLELYATDAASSSGENASSLVNSVRNNTSIYSTQIVKYTEVSSTEKSPISPGFRYSRKFEDSDVFIGFNYAESSQITYFRQIYGNDNSFFRDQAKTRERITGITLGFGPIDYTTQNEDGSGEFAFAYTTTRSRGPYSQYFYKTPSFLTIARIAADSSSSEGALDNYNLLSYSTGQMNFDIETYSLRSGYAWVMGDYFNIYGRMDMDYVQGNIKLSTFSIGSASQALASTATPSIPNANYISYMDARLTGFLFRLELGLVAKLMPGIGFRFGYYGQIPFLTLEIKESFDTFRSSANDPYLTSYREPEPSSLSDRQTVLHGAFFAIVANF